jgi:drug/metabolite transporter, DME family
VATPSRPSGERSPALADRAPRTAGGALVILLGAAAWGTTGTAAHFAPAAASPASVGAGRIAFGGALLLAVALSRGQGRSGLRALVHGTPGIRAAVLIATAAVGGYQIAFFTAVRQTGVAIGTVVAIGSAPVFTGGLSRLAGGPRPDRSWMLATGAAVAGCAVLLTGGRPAGAKPGGVLMALVAGLCYAIYAVAAARLIAAGNPETAVMGALFGGAAVLLAPVLAASQPGWMLSTRGLVVTCYLGAVTTAAAYLLYGRGLRSVPAPVAVTLGLAEPVVAALLGLIVLGEALTPTAVAGLILVGLGLAVLVVAGLRASGRK